MLPVCWPYVARMLAVCWPYASRMLAVCCPYAGRMLAVCCPLVPHSCRIILCLKICANISKSFSANIITEIVLQIYMYNHALYIYITTGLAPNATKLTRPLKVLNRICLLDKYFFQQTRPLHHWLLLTSSPSFSLQCFVIVVHPATPPPPRPPKFLDLFAGSSIR